MREEHIALPSMSPGTDRRITLWRFGKKNARPKAYLQTALHADELPGMMVMHHLRRELETLEKEKQLKGQVVLVPVANPVGLNQHFLGYLTGRFELHSGDNFNRHFPAITDLVAEKVADRLTTKALDNIKTIRAAALEVLGETPTGSDNAVMKHRLLTMAIDADICLDLHCDYEAVMHVYTGTPLWPDARDLSAQLGAHSTLLAEESGGDPFDEAVGGIWWALARRFPHRPIPPACLSATVELRGNRDVEDELARDDAMNLIRFLARRGVIDMDPGPLPALINDATPLEGVDAVTMDRAGLLLYHCKPGDTVKAGDVVAEVVDPLSPPDQARHPLTTCTSGVVYSRRGTRMARPGQVVVRVAGTDRLPGRVSGNLLSD